MDKKHNKFGEGDRVKLRAVPSEGIPEERGYVETDEVSNGTYCVRVDEKYRDAGDSDGIREVTEDQMVRLVRKRPADKVAKFLARIIREAKEILGDEFNFNALEDMKPKGVAASKGVTLEELLAHPRVRKELDGLAGWVLEGVQALAEEEDLEDLDSGPR